MKLSRTSWLFLGVGIVVILAVSLAVALSQQNSDRERLNQELVITRLQMEKYSLEDLSGRTEELQKELTTAEAKLKSARASLLQLIESIEACDTLLVIAEDYDVHVSEFRSGASNGTDIEGISCMFLPVIINVEGDIEDIVDFINEWTEEYPTGAVRALLIEVREESDGEEETEDEAQTKARINMYIYTCGGN